MNITLRRPLLTAAGALLTLLTPCPGSAEEVDVFYMTTTTTDSKSYIIKLDGSFRLPMVYLAEGKIKVNYRSIDLANIEGIRFEMRTETVSGIEETASDSGNHTDGDKVFTLDGRQVDSGAGQLPKGLYIIGKRKVVIR